MSSHNPFQIKRALAAWRLRVYASARSVEQILDDATCLTDLEFLADNPAPHPAITFQVNDVGSSGSRLLDHDARRLDSHLFEFEGFLILLTRDPLTIPETTAFAPHHSPAGTAKFCGLDLTIDEGVFWPSPMLEPLVEMTAGAVPDAELVIDVGTGCGAFTLALARVLSSAQIVGTDLNPAAVTCARENGRRLGIENARFECRNLLHDWPTNIRADAIVCTLPFVPPVEVALLTLESTNWSGPPNTIVGLGEDGLGLLRELANQAQLVLREGGLLLMVGNPWQSELLMTELQDSYEVEANDLALLAFLKTAAT